NTEIDCAGALVAGFGDEIPDSFVPRAVWVAEMFYGQTKGILQKLAAGKDFFTGPGLGEMAQVGVSQGMGSDLMSGVEPGRGLSFVHERFFGIAFDFVPVITAAEG